MKKSTKFIGLVLFILLIIIITGCEEKNTIDDESNKNEDEQVEVVEYEPSFGGELTVPIGNIDTLNPLTNNNRSLYFFSKLIFEGLFQLSPSLDIENLLAKSYSISEDGRIISISLKDNVSWHDGELFTSEDVKFTIEALKYGAANDKYKNLLSNIYKPASLSDFQHILDVKIIDDFNLDIMFDRGYSNALESLIFPIVPKHKFVIDGIQEKAAYERALAMDDYRPVGTGAYKFIEHNKLKSIELSANMEWWNGNVYIEKITGKVLSDNDLAITSFEAKQVDLAEVMGVDWEKYAQDEKVDIIEYNTQNYEFLGFNFARALFDGEKGKALREAIAYGIDRQDIIEKVYLGHATQVDVPVSPSSWLLSEAANTYGYNKEKAKNILEEAGWTDSDEDGIYEDENGKDLEISLLTNSYNIFRKKVADIISENLTDIGIKVIKDYDVNTVDITEDMANKQWENVKNKIATKDFDIVLLEWQLSYIPDLAFAFHSSRIESGTNLISYENEAMDQLLTNAFGASSREEKKEVYSELQELIVNELPYFSLYFKHSALLTNDKIKGDMNPQSFNLFYNIKDWFVPEELENMDTKDENDR